MTKQIVKIGNSIFLVQIAESQLQKSKGLMFRKSMPEFSGMLFLFNNETVRFHMKNTFIPLDIIYVDENNKIVKIDNMIPGVGRSICDVPIYYAIELNQGICKKNNIRVGDSVKLVKQNKKINLRESFEDIEKIKLRIRVNLAHVRFLDILTHIRGIKDVITVTADGQLQPAPDGKNMSNLFVRFENHENVDIENILKQIKSIDGVDIVKVLEYDGTQSISKENMVATEPAPQENQKQTTVENLLRKLVKETLRTL